MSDAWRGGLYDSVLIKISTRKRKTPSIAAGCFGLCDQVYLAWVFGEPITGILHILGDLVDQGFYALEAGIAA
jgi:hypothetical protein